MGNLAIETINLAGTNKDYVTKNNHKFVIVTGRIEKSKRNSENLFSFLLKGFSYYT